MEKKPTRPIDCANCLNNAHYLLFFIALRLFLFANCRVRRWHQTPIPPTKPNLLHVSFTVTDPNQRQKSCRRHDLFHTWPWCTAEYQLGLCLFHWIRLPVLQITAHCACQRRVTWVPMTSRVSWWRANTGSRSPWVKKINTGSCVYIEITGVTSIEEHVMYLLKSAIAFWYIFSQFRLFSFTIWWIIRHGGWGRGVGAGDGVWGYIPPFPARGPRGPRRCPSVNKSL